MNNLKSNRKQILLSIIQVYKLQSSDYVTRWLELNLYPPLPSHSDPLKSRSLVCVWSTVKKRYVPHGCCQSHTGWTDCRQPRGIHYQKIQANLIFQSKNVSSGTVQTSDQMRSCPINYLCVSPFLFCISQHILLLIYAMVLGTASLSQFRYTVYVCNECVYVQCVSVCERESVLMKSLNFYIVHV